MVVPKPGSVEFRTVWASEPFDGWRWVNGEGNFPGMNGGTVYTNWNSAEPNNSGVEDHLTLGRYGLGGGWNDELEGRSSIGGFIVEWDVPLPAANASLRMLIQAVVQQLWAKHWRSRQDPIRTMQTSVSTRLSCLIRALEREHVAWIRW